MRPTEFLGAACCLMILTLPASAQEPKPSALTAKEIMERMAKVYGGCKSYRDSGVTRTVYIEDARTRTELLLSRESRLGRSLALPTRCVRCAVVNNSQPAVRPVKKEPAANPCRRSPRPY